MFLEHEGEELRTAAIESLHPKPKGGDAGADLVNIRAVGRCGSIAAKDKHRICVRIQKKRSDRAGSNLALSFSRARAKTTSATRRDHYDNVVRFSGQR